VSGRPQSELLSATSVAESIMWCLNVLTVPPSGIIAQLDSLKAVSESLGFGVKYVEFGNELFMDTHYGVFFKTADEYMQHINTSLTYARQIFPDAKLAVPAAYRFGGRASESFVDWNERLQAHKHLFDAVTIHDYTASTKSVDDNRNKGRVSYATEQKRSALAAWGQVALDNHAVDVRSYFGDAHEIWMTEWGYAVWVGVPLQAEEGWDKYGTPASAISGIYSAGFLLHMVNRSQAAAAPHTVANHHVFNSMAGNAWGQMSGTVDVASDAGGLANPLEGTRISGAAQIMSHVAYVALSLSDTMMTVHVGPAGLEGCPTLPFGVEGTEDLLCVYAAAFGHSCRPGGMPVYVAINRCATAVSVEIDTMEAELDTAMRTTQYLDSDPGTWADLDLLQGDYAHPWTAGPLSPNVTTSWVRRPIDERPPSVTRVVLQPLSLTVVEFNEPLFRSNAAECPSLDSFEGPACKATCDDVPNQKMIETDRDCATYTWGLENKCNKSAYWASAKTCQKSCFDAGYGYDGSDCGYTDNDYLCPTSAPTSVPIDDPIDVCVGLEKTQCKEQMGVCEFKRETKECAMI